MNLQRTLPEIDLATAKSMGYDLIQPMYAGQKVQLHINKGDWVLGEGPTQLKSGISQPDWSGLLIGVYNRLAERLVITDCWQAATRDVRSAIYRDRFGLCKAMVPYFPDWITLATNFRIDDFAKVQESQKFPGVIFRFSQGRLPESLRCANFQTQKSPDQS